MDPERHSSTDAPMGHDRRTGIGPTIAATIFLVVLGGVLFAIAHGFSEYELEQVVVRRNQPRVESIRPADGETGVSPTSPIYIELFTPATGQGVEVESVSPQTVRLLRDSDGRPVDANITAGADGGSLALSPHQPLETGATYRVEITGELLDETGAGFIPFTSRFTVAAAGSDAARRRDYGFGFEQVGATPSLAPSMFTVMTMRPGQRELLAGTADGRIFRYAITADGTLEEIDIINALPAHNDEPRMVTGLAFDPKDPTTLWVSHGVAGLSGMTDFTGKLSTISGDDLSVYTDRIVSLPRAYKDHLNFAIAFGPDGMLYLSQGSHTSVGAPDIKWNNRPERLLTAAILKIDTDRLPADRPLDVRTTDAGGTYDPFSEGAPLTIHATGVRSGFDLLWHSNGRLYTAINGAGRGGTAPPVPETHGNILSGAILNVPHTTDDTLADVTQPGTYHGHPNPKREENVLMGGNPTQGIDPYEMPAYPVGVRPEPHFAMPIFNFGKGMSANGLAELNGAAFDGKLAGCLAVTRFSAGDDIILLRLDEAGQVAEVYEFVPGLTALGSPLDVLEDRETGNLYVTEFDAQRITLLRPR